MKRVIRPVTLFAIISLVMTAGPAAAQNAARARTIFATAVDATEALLALEVQPADANGALRAWDRRWRARLERFRGRGGGAFLTRAMQCSSPRASCARRELCELDPTQVVFPVLGAREDMLGDMRAHSFAVAASQLAARRLVADEALRRRREGLSCEDLPSSLEVGSSDGLAAIDVPEALRPMLEGLMSLLERQRDPEAALAVARGGPSALAELLQTRATVAQAERAEQARQAAARCETEGAPAELLARVTDALRMGAVRSSRLGGLGLRAAGFDEPDLHWDPPIDWPARRAHDRRRREAGRRVSEGDPQVTAEFIRLVHEEGGDRAPELLVELMTEVYHRISIADAALLIACRSAASEPTDASSATAPPPGRDAPAPDEPPTRPDPY